MTQTKTTLDFIIIGAQKAGTTSLFEYLKRHPEISLPANKEAAYFSHDAELLRGWEDYMERATFVDPACKWGTATPQYMAGGVYDASILPNEAARRYDERTVPLRIRERVPDVRLIAILRDPVKRAHSHHQMAVMNGFEHRPFDEAIGDLLRPDSLESSRRYPHETTSYVTWGEYGRILAGYFDVFPREQILIVFTEELARAPDDLLRRIHEFIGVTPGFVPDNLGTRYRVGGAERRLSWMSPFALLSPQGFKIALARNSVARAVWQTVPRVGQRSIRHAYESFAYRADLWNRRSSTSADGLSATTAARLRRHFAQDAIQLASLLDDMPPWQIPIAK